jgi:hypothetical protein
VDDRLAVPLGLRRHFVAEAGAEQGVDDGVEALLGVLLTAERGWTPDRYEHWLADTWRRLLLPRRAAES